MISGKQSFPLLRELKRARRLLKKQFFLLVSLRANFAKLMPKIKSKKIKVYELVKVDKLYALNQNETDKLEKFSSNMDIIQNEEKVYNESINRIKKYSENSKNIKS